MSIDTLKLLVGTMVITSLIIITTATTVDLHLIGIATGQELLESEVCYGLKLIVNYIIKNDMLEAKMTLVNVGVSSPIEFQTRTSQLFDIIVRYVDGRVEKWSDDKLFLQVLTKYKLNPSEPHTQVLTMSLKGEPKIIIFKTVRLELIGYVSDTVELIVSTTISSKSTTIRTETTTSMIGKRETIEVYRKILSSVLKYFKEDCYMVILTTPKDLNLEAALNNSKSHMILLNAMVYDDGNLKLLLLKIPCINVKADVKNLSFISLMVFYIPGYLYVGNDAYVNDAKTDVSYKVYYQVKNWQDTVKNVLSELYSLGVLVGFTSSDIKVIIEHASPGVILYYHDNKWEPIGRLSNIWDLAAISYGYREALTEILPSSLVVTSSKVATSTLTPTPTPIPIIPPTTTPKPLETVTSTITTYATPTTLAYKVEAVRGYAIEYRNLMIILAIGILSAIIAYLILVKRFI